LGLHRVIDHDRMSIWAPVEAASGQAVLAPLQVEAMRGLLAAVVARVTARPALSLKRPV
jgi:hypothetical protein